MSSVHKPKVMVFIYNSDHIGGPTVSMRMIMQSWLKGKYDFHEIHIAGRLGMIPRIKLILDLAKEIRAVDPDIIHISGLQLHGFYAVLSTRIAGYRNIILTIRGKSTDSLEISGLKKMLFGIVLEPATLAMSKTITTVCEDMANRIKGLRESKKFAGVIPNAMPEVNLPMHENHSIRRELHLDPNDLLLVYSGRVVMEKGIHYLLEAIRGMQHNRVKLLICGEGKDAQGYKHEFDAEIRQKRIFFLGTRSDVLAILSACDVFVFPTLHENLSNALLEAMAIGLPVVTTKVGGNPEIILDGVNGFLVAPYSSEELGSAINKIIHDPSLMQSMGEASLRIGEERFSQSIVYKKIDAVYQRSLGNAKNVSLTLKEEQ
jgi:L-malate glycosyltransferase